MFVGIDVGKGEHHAVALGRKGTVVFDIPLPNDEAKLRAVLQDLKQHGTVLVIVDKPATIGALPIAVPQAEEVADLSMLCGFDDDILGQITATNNRIRGLLTQMLAVIGNCPCAATAEPAYGQ